jgi:hypothetical protein
LRRFDGEVSSQYLTCFDLNPICEIGDADLNPRRRTSPSQPGGARDPIFDAGAVIAGPNSQTQASESGTDQAAV